VASVLADMVNPLREPEDATPRSVISGACPRHFERSDPLRDESAPWSNSSAVRQALIATEMAPRDVTVAVAIASP
jgi:hypothetical protein